MYVKSRLKLIYIGATNALMIFTFWGTFCWIKNFFKWQR